MPAYIKYMCTSFRNGKNNENLAITCTYDVFIQHYPGCMVFSTSRLGRLVADWWVKNMTPSVTSYHWVSLYQQKFKKKIQPTSNCN